MNYTANNVNVHYYKSIDDFVNNVLFKIFGVRKIGLKDTQIKNRSR